MNKKRILITAILLIAVCVIGVVSFVLYRNYKEKQEALDSGTSVIQKYTESFDKADGIEEKEKVYSDLINDSTLNDVIQKYFSDKSSKTDEWYKNYSQSIKDMYSKIKEEYSSSINSFNDEISDSADMNAYCNLLESVTALSDKIAQDNILEDSDKNELNGLVGEISDTLNQKIEEICKSYSDKYDEYTKADINSMSKEDITAAVENLNNLKTEIATLPADYFTELNTNIDTKTAEFNAKLEEIKQKEEEEAAAKAEEEARKTQENSNKSSKKNSSNSSDNSSNSSNKKSDSSSSTNSSDNSSSSSSTGTTYKHNDKIPPLEINGVLFYAPQKVVNLYNSRTTSVWNSLTVTYNGVDACMWFVDGDYNCVADQNGNILEEYID